MKPTAAFLGLAAILPAHAGTSASPSDPSPPISTEASPDWQVRTALYGWAQSLEGDVTVRGNTVPVDLDFGDLLENLDMAFMGMVAVERGRWGFQLDLNYAAVNETLPTPFGIIAPSIDFEMDQWMANSLISYGVLRDESTTLDVLAGARLNSIQIDLGVNNATLSGDQTWVDPIVGLRFQRMLSPSFFFRFVGDIGGFGASSDFTWQAMAGLGWKFSENGSALIGYRSIDTDYEQGNFAYDINAHGPVLGLEFTF
jgi:opacity protein-like surface antigen